MVISETCTISCTKIGVPHTSTDGCYSMVLVLTSRKNRHPLLASIVEIWTTGNVNHERTCSIHKYQLTKPKIPGLWFSLLSAQPFPLPFILLLLRGTHFSLSTPDARFSTCLRTPDNYPLHYSPLSLHCAPHRGWKFYLQVTLRKGIHLFVGKVTFGKGWQAMSASSEDWKRRGKTNLQTDVINF